MTSQALPDPRTSSAELDLRRKGVTDLVCGMPGGEPDQLGFDWSQFQQALIREIEAWENKRPPAASSASSEQEGWSYYEHWVAALETVLATDGLVSREELDEQTREVLAIPPNRNHHEAHTEPIAVDPAPAPRHLNRTPA